MQYQRTESDQTISSAFHMTGGSFIIPGVFHNHVELFGWNMKKLWIAKQKCHRFLLVLQNMFSVLYSANAQSSHKTVSDEGSGKHPCSKIFDVDKCNRHRKCCSTTFYCLQDRKMMLFLSLLPAGQTLSLTTYVLRMLCAGGISCQVFAVAAHCVPN